MKKLTCFLLAATVLFFLYALIANERITNGDYSFEVKIDPHSKHIIVYVYDNYGKQIFYVDTDASVYSKYSIFWINERYILLKSSDIGDYAIKINDNNDFEYSPCDVINLSEYITLYVVFKNKQSKHCMLNKTMYGKSDLLTLIMGDAKQNFSAPLAINGNFNCYAKDLFTRIDDTHFFITDSDGKRQYFNIDNGQIFATKQQ